MISSNPMESDWLISLFQCIYSNDHIQLKSHLSSIAANQDPFSRTYRGQTLLTLAISLNYKEIIQILLEHGASTLYPNVQGWTPYHEAVSIGDRQVLELIYKKRRQEYGDWFNQHGKEILRKLSDDLQDMYVEMHWSFKSFLPFVSKLCPSDVYKIYKKGTSVRIDTTLVGFENLNWIRGDISIIFKEEPEGARLVICDHQRRIIQQIWPKDFSVTDDIIKEDISISLNTEINGQPKIDWSSFSLSRAQSGFLAFKYDKNEPVGPWETQVWNIDTLEMSCNVRREHLEAHPLPYFRLRELEKAKKEQEKKLEQKEKEKEEKEAMKQGSRSRLVITNPDSYGCHELNAMNLDSDSDSSSDGIVSDSEDEESRINNYKYGYRNVMDPGTERDYQEWRAARKAFKRLSKFRPSLDPPTDPLPSFEEFFDSKKKKQYIHVGRKLDVEEKTRNLRATLWMHDSESTSSTSLIPIQSPHFPLKLSHITPFLELIGMGGNEHIRSLREFFHIQLPAGFPVQIEFPIDFLPVSALIRFENVKFGTTTGGSALPELNVTEGFFDIPGDKDGYRPGDVFSSRSFEDSYFMM